MSNCYNKSCPFRNNNNECPCTELCARHQEKEILIYITNYTETEGVVFDG